MVSNDSRENYTPIINDDFLRLQIDCSYKEKKSKVSFYVSDRGELPLSNIYSSAQSTLSNLCIIFQDEMLLALEKN